jgi:DHA1 family bicyclomycin/chloramphenicol resistance-like MFS transporter
VTAFVVGLAVGQLVAGPVSDSTGRRWPVVGGAVAFAVLSLVCALAPGAGVLVAARLAQGLVAGAAVAVGRAVVADRYEGDAAARRYGTLAGITLIAPVLAPAVGGLLLGVGSWRTVFAFLTALGVAMTAAALLGVPETLPREHRQASGLRSLGARTADLLTDRAFLSPVAVQCLATAGFFVYIGGSSFVLQSQLGIGPGLYSAVFATDAAAMVTASWVFRALVVRRGAVALRWAGLGASAAPSAAPSA